MLASIALPLSAQVSVLTYQYDNTRAGANVRETALTKSSVNATQFGKLFAYSVDGYVYGQPLYVPAVSIAGKGTHNEVFVVTEHDSVYAFDADGNTGANAAPLWQVSFLGPGVTSVPATDTGCDQIVPEIGITSTPVIDQQSGTLYAVAMTKESSGYVQRLHALDITTGAERPGSPVTVQATATGTGEGGTTLVFNPRNYKQRPGLLLLNGVVYTAWSSHCDIGPYHGWLIGYDATTLQQVAVYNSTPNGNQGSFWASGAAPAADADGNIFVVTGNGSFDYGISGPDLGEAYIKLATTGGLAVADYFAPFNYDRLNIEDTDVGSAGVALLGDEAGNLEHPHLLAGAGKEGRIYLLDRDGMGGLDAKSDSQIVQSISGAVGGLFGNPAYYNRAVYFCGSGDNLKAFPISNARMATTPGSQSAAQFDFPGCIPSVSANGASNGIVWILESSGALHAYDAANLSSELYNSNQNRPRDALSGDYVKFSAPAVANGKVYAGSTNALSVYGLLPSSKTVSAANAANGASDGIAAGSLVSIYGTGLSNAATGAPGLPLPELRAGVSVEISGQLAPVLYVSAGQINVQVPWEAPAGSASLSVTVNGAPAGQSTVTIQAAAPGLFLLFGGRAAALNQDYSINSQSRPAAAGSVLSAFLTGLGETDHPVPTGAAAGDAPLANVLAPVSATIGGQTAQVQFAGLAPGYVGLYQVNLMVPQLAPGDYPLTISVAGVASNSGTVSVR